MDKDNMGQESPIEKAIKKLITEKLKPIDIRTEELSQKADKTENHFKELTKDIQRVKKVEESIEELDKSLTNRLQTTEQTFSKQVDEKLKEISEGLDKSVSEKIKNETPKILVGLILLIVTAASSFIQLFEFIKAFLGK